MYKYFFIFSFFISATCHAEPFSLSSNDLQNGAFLKSDQVFNNFGCTGKNISPHLKWHNAPVATKSFAITVYDPDAPTGSGWWHWLMINIPANVNELKAGAGNLKSDVAPTASQQYRNDFGFSGYGGACPPAGADAHRYQFRVFALDTEKLNLNTDSSAALVGFYINAHKLAEASIEAKYARTK